MELTQNQALDAMMAIASSNDVAFKLLSTGYPVIKRKTDDKWQNIESLDVVKFEKFCAANIRGVPSALSPLGGIGKIKDTRKATVMINRLAFNPHVEYQPDVVIERIKSSLDSSGGRLVSARDPDIALTDIFSRSKGKHPREIVNLLSASGVTFTWDKHYHYGQENDKDSLFLGKAGPSDPKFIASQITSIHALHPSSFIMFQLTVNQFFAEHQLSVSLFDNKEDPMGLSAPVYQLLRGAYDRMPEGINDLVSKLHIEQVDIGKPRKIADHKKWLDDLYDVVGKATPSEQENKRKEEALIKKQNDSKIVYQKFCDNCPY